MTIEHKFYLNGKEILELPNSKWCDTANPYIYAANKLHWINTIIKKGEVILIISNQKEVEVKSGHEFFNWVQNEFNSKSNGGFENYINEGYK